MRCVFAQGFVNKPRQKQVVQSAAQSDCIAPGQHCVESPDGRDTDPQGLVKVSPWASVAGGHCQRCAPLSESNPRSSQVTVEKQNDVVSCISPSGCPAVKAAVINRTFAKFLCSYKDSFNLLSFFCISHDDAFTTKMHLF